MCNSQMLAVNSLQCWKERQENRMVDRFNFLFKQLFCKNAFVVWPVNSEYSP